MSKRLDEARARAAKIVAEAEAEESLRETLPVVADVGEPSVYFVRKDEVWVSYPCATVGEVLNVLAAFAPWVQCERAKAGGMVYAGPVPYVRAHVPVGVVGEPYHVALALHGGRGFGPSAEWTVHTDQQVGGRAVRVAAKLEDCTRLSLDRHVALRYPSGLRVASQIKYDGNGSVTRAVHIPPTSLGDIAMTRYAAGSDEAYHFVYYWNDLNHFTEEMLGLEGTK